MSDGKLDLVLNKLKNVNARLELLKDANTKLELLEDINARLELLELKQDLTHKKLDNLTLDVKVSERSIKKDISFYKTLRTLWLRCWNKVEFRLKLNNDL